MEKKYIKYKEGYKYQIVEDYNDKVDVYPNGTVENDYIRLNANGELFIKKGYAWDGPSGPTFDSETFMRGSLVHDALYQLIREKKIHVKCREQADKELYEDCREDGMSWFRAKYVLFFVRKFAGKAAKPGNTRKVIIAPKFHGIPV